MLPKRDSIWLTPTRRIRAGNMVNSTQPSRREIRVGRRMEDRIQPMRYTVPTAARTGTTARPLLDQNGLPFRSSRSKSTARASIAGMARMASQVGHTARRAVTTDRVSSSHSAQIPSCHSPHPGHPSLMAGMRLPLSGRKREHALLRLVPGSARGAVPDPHHQPFRSGSVPPPRHRDNRPPAPAPGRAPSGQRKAAPTARRPPRRMVGAAGHGLNFFGSNLGRGARHSRLPHRDRTRCYITLSRFPRPRVRRGARGAPRVHRGSTR